MGSVVDIETEEACSDRDLLAERSNQLQVRVLTCGAAAGLIVEARRSLAVGTIAMLHISFSGCDVEEAIQVVRCDDITGSGHVYHVGIRLLSRTPLFAEWLQYVIRRETGDVRGSISRLRES
jgi:hypothetical protein